MELETAVVRLSALAQNSRLAVFRLLVQKGPAGMPAGEIAEHLGVAPNALSFHLKELSHAGLLTSRPEGRYIYYAPDFAAMNEVWDAWVPEGHAPARTCVTAPMPADELKVEITVTAVVEGY